MKKKTVILGLIIIILGGVFFNTPIVKHKKAQALTTRVSTDKQEEFMKKLGFSVEQVSRDRMLYLSTKYSNGRPFAGLFVPSVKKIYILTGNMEYAFHHEFAHLVDYAYAYKYTCNNAKFDLGYFTEEEEVCKSGIMTDYYGATRGEYFAESFSLIMNGGMTQIKFCMLAPYTYQFMLPIVNQYR